MYLLSENTMRKVTRRALLKSSVVGVAATVVPAFAARLETVVRKGRIHQSVCQWCYPHIPVDQPIGPSSYAEAYLI